MQDELRRNETEQMKQAEGAQPTEQAEGTQQTVQAETWVPRGTSETAERIEPVREWTEEGAEADPLGDNMPIWNFHGMTQAELGTLSANVFPELMVGDLAFCQGQIRAERRPVTYGEMRLLERLVAERRASAEGYVLSQIRIDDRRLAETYEDMMAKVGNLYPDRKTPFTVEDLADVAGAYLSMIGRSDRSEAVHFEEELPPVPGTAFVLLSPADPSEEPLYEERLAAMLADPEVEPLSMRRMKVGRFGILGTLGEYCDGVFADYSLLPRGEGEALSLCELATAHIGRTLLSATRDNAAWLCRFAERFGLRADYFAKATDTGRWRTSRDVLPSVDLSIPFLRALLEGKDRGDMILSEENFRAAGRTESVPCGDWVPESAKMCVALRSEAESNPFSAAINTALEAVTVLVSRGIDRRAVGLSHAFTLPRYRTEAEEMGRNLSLILGAYRVSMELAAPQREVAVEYTDEPRRITCTAYSPRAGLGIPARFVKEGSKLVYLSFRRNEDGLPDFESVRQMCDSFCAMCRDGAVYSARAVTGDLMAAIRSMTLGGEVSLGSVAKEYGACYCQGILIETDDARGLPELGVVVSLQKREEPTENGLGARDL